MRGESEGVMTVDVECPACRATGVYSGFAEPKGVAVVCLRCDGTGRQKLSYKPFTVRKRRDGVETVKRSQGAFIGTGVGPAGAGVSYEDFLRGRMP
jgi:hypothetical protein